jgi:hypothetical protein
LERQTQTRRVGAKGYFPAFKSGSYIAP